jgi:hypothetical protein
MEDKRTYSEDDKEDDEFHKQVQHAVRSVISCEVYMNFSVKVRMRFYVFHQR